MLARWPQALRHLYALSAILVGWVLFRAETFAQALAFLGRMMGLGDPLAPDAPGVAELVNHQQWLFGLLGILVATPWPRRLLARLLTDRSLRVKRRGGVQDKRASLALDLSFVAATLFLCSLSIASGTYNPFIYFRF